MKVESLEELRVAFEVWRSKKRHTREAVPDALMERARGTIAVHGLGSVSRVTKIDRARLIGNERGRIKSSGVVATHVPSFSRVVVAAPAATSCPIVEIETPTGMKLRIFTQTHETLSLLSSLCGMGGA